MLAFYHGPGMVPFLSPRLAIACMPAASPSVHPWPPLYVSPLSWSALSVVVLQEASSRQTVVSPHFLEAAFLFSRCVALEYLRFRDEVTVSRCCPTLHTLVTQVWDGFADLHKVNQIDALDLLERAKPRGFDKTWGVIFGEIARLPACDGDDRIVQLVMGGGGKEELYLIPRQTGYWVGDVLCLVWR